MSHIGRWALGAVVAATVVALVLRSCKSDEEILSDSVNDARDALTAGDRAGFLTFFAPQIAYQKKHGRKELERDLDRWIEAKVVRVVILERKIAVDHAAGVATATIHLRCAVGAGMESIGEVGVDLSAEKTDDHWMATSFSWK